MPLPSVAVAMSGGVDSSVATALLVQTGHRVVGFTLKLWDPEDEEHARKVCCAATMARDARMVCEQLGIPHYTLDLRADFRREVVARFESDYLNGRTPNPCVHCNSSLKWGSLWQKARALGLERLATGHYARTVNGSGRVRLLKGLDRQKDQSYFLWEIPADLLAVTIFPLGEMTKQEVRAIARDLNLPVSEKEESQEVCFIPRNDYRSWLKARNPAFESGELSGDMIDENGAVIGKHPGYPLFTIGQHKGLGLGGGGKRFVTRIDPTSKRVHLGDLEDLKRDRFSIGDLNHLQDASFDGSETYSVKIRYRDPGVAARVFAHGGDILHIETDRPVNAVTPGQSAVIYRDEEVIAGGIILN